MKLIFLITAVLTSIICSGQNKNKKAQTLLHSGNQTINDTSIDSWAKSVVNIECLMQTYSNEQIEQYINKIKLDTTKKMSETQIWNLETELRSLQNKSNGTGILIRDGEKKYILTAKHVIEDPNGAYNEQSRIAGRLFITTEYDNLLKGIVTKNIAMNLGAGTENSRPYIFSDNTTDIAIISLQSSSTKDILDDILKAGLKFKPIDVIDTFTNYKTGDDIFAIGYPGISIIGKISEQNSNWHSNTISSAITTFGRISMHHKQLPYFIGDITVYPGNSGGPVITNDKLIGFVDQQIGIPLDTKNPIFGEVASNLSARGTLALIHKSNDIILWLRKLQTKEISNFFR